MDILSQHLPKILDLASNFNIDLGGILSVFAQKLHDDVPEFKDGFSFPQAALILQQCTEIYGRKVDYVYSLAMELCENMNSRMYTSESAEHQQEATSSPKKILRRRKVLGGTLSFEDFQFMTISLDNLKAVTKSSVKRREKHTSEYVSLRLQPSSFSKSDEFHIFDDYFASIGRKDQFRLNWHIDDKCRLEEFIKDEGSDSSWNVCDVGVNNMPTPAYSDEGVAQDVLNDTFLEGNDDIVTDNVNEPLSTTTSIPLTQELGAKFDIVSCEINQPVKPLMYENTFKLPYELTAKGLRTAKPELNITLFFFSDMLKRSLNMSGPLPPPTKERNGDKKLIAKHITFLKNRYHLDIKNTRSVDAILEPQPDFFGFEEVLFGGDVPDVLTAIEAPPTRDLPPTNCPSEENFNVDATEDICLVVPDNTSKRKSTVDKEGIATWKDFILHKLADYNQESDFDVHAYGSGILSAFNHDGEKTSFGELVGGLERREVSKHFLSVLMLANTENLSLQEDGPNTLQMTLLSSERHQDMERDLVPLCFSASGSGDRAPCKRKVTNCFEEEPTDKRSRKQSPGKGPWINKSKKK